MHNSTINCVTIETITYPLVLFCGLCLQRSPQALGFGDFTKSADAVIRDVSLNNDQWPKYSKDLQMTSSEETTVCEKNTISLERRGVPDEIGSGAWKKFVPTGQNGNPHKFVDWLVMIRSYVFDTDICNWSQRILMYRQYYRFPLTSKVLLFISCVHCILPKCALSVLVSLLLIPSGLSGSVPFTRRLRVNLETRPELDTRKYLCKRHFACCYHSHHM